MTACDPLALEDCHCKKKHELQALVCRPFCIIFDDKKGMDELEGTKAARVSLDCKPSAVAVARRMLCSETHDNDSDESSNGMTKKHQNQKPRKSIG